MEILEILATFIAYFVGIFGAMCVLIFLWFFIKELLRPASRTTTPDDDIQLTDSPSDINLASEINRAATELAAHKAKEKTQ